jgi:hypothetical protein
MPCHRRKKERKKERMKSVELELILAASENILPEIERLLSVGVNVNAKNEHDLTPLHVASCYGHL